MIKHSSVRLARSPTAFCAGLDFRHALNNIDLHLRVKRSEKARTAMTAMLVCLRQDHKQNFIRTAALADLLSASVDSTGQLASHGPSLLRFYAAESGLKYLLNRIERVPFSYQVKEQNFALDSSPLSPKNPGKVEGYSHDLALMLRRLKVSAAAVSPPTGPFRTIGGHNNGQDFEIPRAHEAWRYGLATELADQIALEEFLAAIITYVQGEI